MLMVHGTNDLVYCIIQSAGHHCRRSNREHNRSLPHAAGFPLHFRLLPKRWNVWLLSGHVIAAAKPSPPRLAP